MKYIIIIPAREGSKRLKNKNFINFRGIQLIEHSIKFALSLDFIKNKSIWVNSDSNMIKGLKKKYKINFHLRPKKLGNDFTPTVDVLKEQLLSLNDNFNNVILLQPTNPLRNVLTFKKAINIFEKSKRNSLFSVSMSNKKYGFIKDDIFEPVNYLPGYRSQDIDKLYFENGNFYIVKKECVLKNLIITKDSIPFIDNHPYSEVDIDDIDDLKFANFIKDNY